MIRIGSTRSRPFFRPLRSLATPTAELVPRGASKRGRLPSNGARTMLAPLGVAGTIRARSGDRVRFEHVETDLVLASRPIAAQDVRETTVIQARVKWLAPADRHPSRAPAGHRSRVVRCLVEPVRDIVQSVVTGSHGREVGPES